MNHTTPEEVEAVIRALGWTGQDIYISHANDGSLVKSHKIVNIKPEPPKK